MAIDQDSLQQISHEVVGFDVNQEQDQHNLGKCTINPADSYAKKEANLDNRPVDEHQEDKCRRM